MTAALLSLILSALPLPPVAPEPAWVVPVEVPAVAAGADGASVQLLRDTQVLAGKTLELHERNVWKVLTLSGVESLAQHEFEWDPSYERLVLHGLWVWRDGNRRSAWHPDDARVLQRETSLDEGIYDGRLVLRVELRDLRVGDVVEVASTTIGENPVYRGHFSRAFSQTTGSSVQLDRTRLVWQRGRPLAWKTHGGALAPTVTGTAGGQEYAWTLRDLKSKDYESSVPPDVEQAPWVEFSDWTSWAEVVQWAQRLYEAPGRGPRLAAAVARFQALPDDAARIRAIVRFVQDDIRYVGVELGEHSHQPHDPEWVLERGFGDCKDKALLLVRLLREAGLEAWPALVHSRGGTWLPASLPSVNAFNHVIARVQFPGGASFVDGTQTLRRGDPARWEPPDVAHALVVKPGTRALEPVPTPPGSGPTWAVHQHWVVPSFEGPATLDVETVASGNDAAVLRARVSESSRAKLTEHRRTYLAESLDVELVSTGLEVEDDEAAERVVLREHYTVKGFFQDFRHAFETLAIDGELAEPPNGTRTLPWARSHPLRLEDTITYDAPEALSQLGFDLENRTISHPAFELRLKQSVSGKRLFLGWQYATRADRVAPSELEAYRLAVRDARGTLGYSVRQRPGDGPGGREQRDEGSSWVWVLALGGAVGTLFLITRPEPSVDKPSFRARLRRWRFRSRQKGAAGELATDPLVLARVEDAAPVFRSRACPAGHPWPEGVAPLDTVRLGDERLTVVGRRCAACGASEHRYVRLRG